MGIEVTVKLPLHVKDKDCLGTVTLHVDTMDQVVEFCDKGGPSRVLFDWLNTELTATEANEAIAVLAERQQRDILNRANVSGYTLCRKDVMGTNIRFNGVEHIEGNTWKVLIASD